MRNKVMIVVEGELYGRLLEKEFQSKGYGVCAVLDRGEEAVEKAKKDRPDTILLDFLLRGDLDGIETAKLIQVDSSVSVVFLNNRVESNWLFKAEGIKSSAVIDKLEFSPGNIVDMVASAAA